MLSPVGNAYANEESLDDAKKRIAQLEQEVLFLKKENKQLHTVHATSNSTHKNLSKSSAILQAAAIPRIIKGDEKIVSSSRGFEGFYIGANAGYGGGELDNNYTALLGTTGYDQNNAPTNAAQAISGLNSTRMGGALAGIQFGYNLRGWNSLVLSGEADFQWSDVASRSTNSNQNYITNITRDSFNGGPVISSSDIRTGLRWFGTVRARIGYDFGNIMPYITAGLAYAHSQSQNYNSFTFVSQYIGTFTSGGSKQGQSLSGNNSSTKLGWTAGGGIEYKILDNLSLRSEYLFTRYGAPTDPLLIQAKLASWYSTTSSLGYQSNVFNPYNVHQVRFGVNYHLDLAQAQSAIKAAY